jgi:betaine reductase
MRAAIGPLVALGYKLAQGKPIGNAAREGYIPRGYRKNAFVEKSGAERAVQMLLAKLKGAPFQTELPLPVHDHVPPAKPIASISAASIALVTEGGIVPKGNPDGIESRRATKWVRYSLKGLNELSSASHECVHGGFDTDVANEAPDRILPLDVMRQLETEGAFGKLFDDYFVTVGNSSTISNAKKYGREIAKELLAAGVKGVVFPAT